MTVPRFIWSSDRVLATAPGVNAETLADRNDRELVTFNTDWNALGLPVFAVGKAQTFRKVTHGLGYKPVFDVAVIETDVVWATKMWNPVAGFSGGYYSHFAYVTDQHLVPGIKLLPASDYNAWNDGGPIEQSKSAWHNYVIFARAIDAPAEREV